MNRKDTIIRALIVLSGVIFAVSALTGEWKITLLAIVPLLVATIYGVFGPSAEPPREKLEELLKGKQGPP